MLKCLPSLFVETAMKHQLCHVLGWGMHAYLRACSSVCLDGTPVVSYTGIRHACLPESLQQCLPGFAKGGLKDMWHRGRCQLKAFLECKEGLLQLGCAMALQEGCSKDRLHSCWKQDVLDTAHQVCLHRMTGNLVVSAFLRPVWWT